MTKRSEALDKLRGFAILLMIVDHVLLLTDTALILRYTVTRLSMPLFFLISGHLVSRINPPRLAVVAATGIAIPLYAEWIDSPNVLVIYAVFAPVIVLVNRRALFGIIAVALAMYANGYGLLHTHAYAPLALAGLMATGKLVPRRAWSAEWLPAFTAYVGRYPLTIYVGHILVLETIRRFTDVL